MARTDIKNNKIDLHCERVHTNEWIKCIFTCSSGMTDERQIIEGCKAQERKAQSLLWKRYAPTMMSICLRYLRNRATAEDVLVHAMYKVMTKIDSYSGTGSFEGWMKRIVINESLMELRRNKNHQLTLSIDDIYEEPEVAFEDHLEYEEVLALLNDLPLGYRTVFNLYVIEGYKHREIAEQLGISINTSKSQLILARRRLQSLVKKKYKVNRATG